MRILDSNKKNFYTKLNKIINKRKNINKSNFKTVEKIINNVRKNKDKALVYYEQRFNGNSQIVPNKKEIAKAIKQLDPKIKRAIDDTYKRVKDWHSKQKPKDIYYKDYWLKNKVNKMPPKLKHIYFDMCINLFFIHSFISLVCYIN